MKKCFKDEEIDAYLLHRLPEDGIQAFEEHYFCCSRCFRRVAEREELLAVIKKRRSEIFGGSSAPETPRESWPAKVLDFFTPRQWVFVGLSVIALAVILFWLMPARRPAPPHFVLDGEDILRGETLALISPVIDVKTAPALFEWRALDGAADYKVSLYGQSPIWSAMTKETKIDIPEEVKAKLEPGQKYSWQVKAFSAQGLLISVSSRVHFQIAR
jgi:hypothetical protein